jgi:ubiquinone/menaquinone biosynthesis C-methylase UbiE
LTGHPHDPFAPAVVRAAYDAVAPDYTAAFADDLDRLPVERLMLDAALASRPPAAGGPGSQALDLGCGPGSVAAYLADNDASAIGVDLSAGMLAQARLRYPKLALVQADLRGLPLSSAHVGLAVAYFAIQHLPRPDVPAVLAEVRRVLVPGGIFLLATHLGVADVTVESFLGHHIATLGGALYAREEIIGQLHAAGFEIDLEKQRGPLPHEVDTQRIYLLARRVEG